MKSSDPRTFWKLLNGSGSEKQETYSKISCDTFMEHFKNLGLNTQEDEDTGNNSNNIESNLYLDEPISDEEVLNALHKLKNNKAKMWR